MNSSEEKGQGQEAGERGGRREREDGRWRRRGYGEGQNLVLKAIFSWAASLWSRLKKIYLVKQSVFQSPMACKSSGSAPKL